jgi:hypothetical protein
MGEHDGVSGNDAEVELPARERVRRPIPERTAPHRDWQNLYTMGAAADAAANAIPIPNHHDDDPSARIVRAGYRTLEENLRRGRLVAEGLHAGSDSRALTLGASRQSFVTALARAFFDPALVRPLQDVAESWLRVLSLPARFERASAQPYPASHPPSEPVPLHPQQRAEYRADGARNAPRAGGPQLLGLSQLRPGEWVGELSIGGRVRRVQIRELEEV